MESGECVCTLFFSKIKKLFQKLNICINKNSFTLGCPERTEKAEDRGHYQWTLCYPVNYHGAHPRATRADSTGSSRAENPGTFRPENHPGTS